MKQMYSLILVLCLLILSSCNLIYENEEIELSLPAEGIESVVLNLSMGDVEIVGEDRENIYVIGDFATATDTPEEAKSFRENQMTLTLDKKDETTAQIKSQLDFKKDESAQARIHLKVYVPKNIHIDIRQDSGELFIHDIYNHVNINHGLGDMVIENIHGDVKIMDGQGIVGINNIKGNLMLNNSQGLVTIASVEGNMKLTGGPGSLDIQESVGNVEIVSGSGNIKIDSLTGDVHIIENRSGTVELTNINGNIIQ